MSSPYLFCPKCGEITYIIPYADSLKREAECCHCEAKFTFKLVEVK